MFVKKSTNRFTKYSTWFCLRAILYKYVENRKKFQEGRLKGGGWVALILLLARPGCSLANSHAFLPIPVFEPLQSLITKLQGRAKNSCLFEFSRPHSAQWPRQPMHSPSALTEHVSPNVAGFFCSTLYMHFLEPFNPHHCLSDQSIFKEVLKSSYLLSLCLRLPWTMCNRRGMALKDMQLQKLSARGSCFMKTNLT